MNDKTGEKRIGTKIAAALLWLAVWQIASMALGKSFVLPSPVFTCQRLLQLCMQGSFWLSCAVTLLRVLAGLLLACLLGFACALAAQKSRTVREILSVPAAAIRSVPVMSVILIALLCMKSAAVPLFVCFLMCFPVMYTNILQGFENIPAEYRELAQVYRVTGSGGSPQQPADLHGLSLADCQDVPRGSGPVRLDCGHRTAVRVFREGAALRAEEVVAWMFRTATSC